MQFQGMKVNFHCQLDYIWGHVGDILLDCGQECPQRALTKGEEPNLSVGSTVPWAVGRTEQKGKGRKPGSADLPCSPPPCQGVH